jgi:hypothetical protein
MNTIQWKNPSHSGKNSRRLVFPSMHDSQSSLPMHSTANKIAPLVPCKSIRIHFHHFTSSRPPLPEKIPKAMADKGKQPLEENNFPPKKRTIRE